MKKVVFLVFAMAGLSACQTNSLAGATSYAGHESGRMMQTMDGCTVEQARYVRINRDDRAAMQRRTGAQAVGTVAGGVIGHAIGDRIGNGNDAARILGALAGATVGYNVGDSGARTNATQVGVEYTLRLQEGRGFRTVTIVQPVDREDPVLGPGDACRIVHGARDRVLPR